MKKTKYLEAWFARAWLLAAMVKQGISRLSGTTAITLKEFSEAFPDSKAWFSRLAAHKTQYESLQDYFNDVGFTGKPEFFSAMACLLLGKGMHINPQWLEDHTHELQTFSKKYRSHHKLHVVPARAVRAVIKGDDPGEA